MSVRPRLEQLEDRSVPSVTVGTNINITHAPGSQAESTISINPTNPQNLFECDTLSNVGHYTLDGGATWRVSNLSVLSTTIGDMQTAWDQFGNLFLTRLTTTNLVVVARSADGGATFKDPRAVGANFSDQPSIAVGAGAVWVSFTDSHNELVAAGAPVTGLDAVGAFGPPEVAPGPGGDFGDIAIGPNGQVLAVYQSISSGQGPDTIKASLDLDGLGPMGFQNYTVAASTNVGSFHVLPAQPGRSMDAEANLAWDRSGGLYNGRVYLVYTDANPSDGNDTNIMVSFSDDNGTSWSTPTQVNDDATTRSQFLPAIAVDQATGNVAVTWYDARNSASNTTVQVFGTVSFDSGATFEPNVQVSAGTTDATVAAASPFNLGDYDKMDFSHGVFYRGWADNSNSTGDNPNGALNALDIYTAGVTVLAPTTSPTVTAPADQTGVEGVTGAFDLGSFSDPNGGPWTVDVNWGDSTSHTIFSAGPGGLGTKPHTYGEDGNYTVTVTVTDGTYLSGSASYQIVVAEPPISVSGPITAKGKKVNNETVATFTHGTGGEPATAFVAMIDWGDGTSSQGSISQSGTTYTVTGTHVYSKGGQHTVTTSVTEVGEVPFGGVVPSPGVSLFAAMNASRYGRSAPLAPEAVLDGQGPANWLRADSSELANPSTYADDQAPCDPLDAWVAATDNAEDRLAALDTVLAAYVFDDPLSGGLSAGQKMGL
jgi:hypothetical protein